MNITTKFGYTSVVGKQIPTTALRQSTLVKQHQRWLKNISGQQLYSKVVESNILQIEISTVLAKGIYFIKISNTNYGTTTKKLVIE